MTSFPGESETLGSLEERRALFEINLLQDQRISMLEESQASFVHSKMNNSLMKIPKVGSIFQSPAINSNNLLKVSCVEESPESIASLI